jgi:hypothetical protein
VKRHGLKGTPGSPDAKTSALRCLRSNSSRFERGRITADTWAANVRLYIAHGWPA